MTSDSSIPAPEIRIALPGDAERIVSHMVRIAEDKATRMCKTGAAITPATVRAKMAQGGFFYVLVFNNEVKAMISCTRFAVPELAWIGYSVEQPFRWSHAFKYNGERLTIVFIREALSRAKNLTPPIATIRSCVRSDNDSSIHLLQNSGFVQEGLCEVATCQRDEAFEYQKWVLKL